MFTYTIVCYGAEIACGTGSTFESAARDAAQQVDHSEWYPKKDWGYISIAPSGLTIKYNV